MPNFSLVEPYSFEELFLTCLKIGALEQEQLKLAYIKKLFNEQHILNFQKKENIVVEVGLPEYGLYYFLLSFGLIE